MSNETSGEHFVAKIEATVTSFISGPKVVRSRCHGQGIFPMRF